MHLKRTPILLALVCLTGLYTACEQKANTITADNSSMRIPVSVKDSMILSIDKSPMDMCYFPEDYPKQKMVTPGMPNPVVRLIYSRPQRNGRIVFGDSSQGTKVIQHYGQEWRLGANEATEIEFFKDVTISEKKVKAGRYILYCIPFASRWIVILNDNLYSWGLHIDPSKDIASIELPVIKNNINIEYFSMLFQNSTYGCDLVMAWGDVKVAMPINF